MSCPPSYQLRIWKGEQWVLNDLTTEDKARLKECLEEIAKTENPYQHNHVGHLKGTDLLKVKLSNVRAIVRYHKPFVDVLVVGYRKNVYDKVETAKQRANAA